MKNMMQSSSASVDYQLQPLKKPLDEQARKLLSTIWNEVFEVNRQLDHTVEYSLAKQIKTYEDRLQRLIGLTLMATAKLNISLDSNLVLEKYENSIKSFQQAENGVRQLNLILSLAFEQFDASILGQKTPPVEMPCKNLMDDNLDEFNDSVKPIAANRVIVDQLVDGERTNMEIVNAETLRGYNLKLISYRFIAGQCFVHINYYKSRINGDVLTEINDLFRFFPSVVTRYIDELQAKEDGSYEKFAKRHSNKALLNCITSRIERNKKGRKSRHIASNLSQTKIHLPADDNIVDLDMINESFEQKHPSSDTKLDTFDESHVGQANWLRSLSGVEIVGCKLEMNVCFIEAQYLNSRDEARTLFVELSDAYNCYHKERLIEFFYEFKYHYPNRYEELLSSKTPSIRSVMSELHKQMEKPISRTQEESPGSPYFFPLVAASKLRRRLNVEVIGYKLDGNVCIMEVTYALIDQGSVRVLAELHDMYKNGCKDELIQFFYKLKQNSPDEYNELAKHKSPYINPVVTRIAKRLLRKCTNKRKKLSKNSLLI